MKFLFAALILAAPAYANENGKDCGPQDYAALNQALNGKIESGAKLRGEITGLLAEEMGPRCTRITDDRPGIPGDHFDEYDLESGSRTYKIFVHTSVESPLSASVKIIKLNAN